MTTVLTQRLEEIFGLDIGFDGEILGTQDATIEEVTGADLNYQLGPAALKEEIERLFITPKGSCVDDPSYGIDLEVIGTQVNPLISTGLCRIAVLDAFEHPSFANRFQVAELEVIWTPNAPGAISIWGVLEVFGFEGTFWQFGPVALELARS